MARSPGTSRWMLAAHGESIARSSVEGTLAVQKRVERVDRGQTPLAICERMRASW
jgi:hypothetical protein